MMIVGSVSEYVCYLITLIEVSVYHHVVLYVLYAVLLPGCYATGIYMGARLGWAGYGYEFLMNE